MMTFFHTAAKHRARPPTLEERRRRNRMMRIAASLCAFFMVFAICQCVIVASKTQPMLIAAVDISRGDAIEASDVLIVQIPAHAALQSVLNSKKQAVGSMARVDIGKGNAIYPSMTVDMPAVPAGYTVLNVRIASDGDDIEPGDMLSLLSSIGCSADEAACTVSDNSMAMDIARSNDSGIVTLPCAMPADEAAGILSIQDAGAIIAVKQPP